MMKAVIYARYSSASQNEQSIDGQLRECNEYAEKNGYVIIKNYIDREISGQVEDRPEFQQMIADSSKGEFEAVIVYKLDRFSRSMEHSIVYTEKLKKNGVKLISINESIADTSEGKLMRAIYSAMAEMYIDDLRQKVKRGNRENRLKGLYTGGVVLFGYKVENKKVIIDDEKAEIVRGIFRDYASGKSKTQIVNELNAKGIKNHSGKPFKTSSLQENMKNKKYTGIYEKDGRIYDNIYPRIIDDDLFEKVQNRLKTVQRYHSKKLKTEYFLTGKAFCLHCGSSMVGVSGTARNGEKKCYYACCQRYKYKACNKSNEKKDGIYIENGVQKLGLEDDVVRMTYDYILKPENLDIIGEKLEQFRKKNTTENRIKEYEKRLANIENEIEKCFEMAMKSMSDVMIKMADQKVNDLSIKKADLEKELAELKLANKLQHTKADFIILVKKYLDGDIHDKEFQKQIINTFVNSVWVADDYTICFYNLVGKQPLTLEEVKDIIAEYGLSVDKGVLIGNNAIGNSNLAVLTRQVEVHQNTMLSRF